MLAVLFLFFSGKFQGIRKTAFLQIDSRKWNRQKETCVIIGENAVHKKIVIRAVFYLLWLVPIRKKDILIFRKKQRRPQEMGQFLNSKKPYDLHTQTRRASISKHSFCLHPGHRRLRFLYLILSLTTCKKNSIVTISASSTNFVCR